MNLSEIRYWTLRDSQNIPILISKFASLLHLKTKITNSLVRSRPKTFLQVYDKYSPQTQLLNKTHLHYIHSDDHAEIHPFPDLSTISLLISPFIAWETKQYRTWNNFLGMYVCACMHVHMKARGQLWVLLLRCHPSCVSDTWCHWSLGILLSPPL